MAERILVTARSLIEHGQPHLQRLAQAGYEVVVSPHDRPLKGHELGPLWKDAVGAILGLDEVNAEALRQASCLRVISRFGVGVDNIDLDAVRRRNIVVTVTPGANSIAVAELTLGLMLSLARRIPLHDRRVREGTWQRVIGVELHGLTAGLIGLGRIGQEVAHRVRALGMQVLFYDLLTPPASVLQPLDARQCPLEELLRESDVVSLHVPLTAQTRGMIGARELALMKPSAFLVNTARGELVDEAALYQALVERRLAGAAMDVFAQEPPGPSNPLLKLDNFIATSHIGAATVQAIERMARMAVDNLLEAL